MEAKAEAKAKKAKQAAVAKQEDAFHRNLKAAVHGMAMEKAVAKRYGSYAALAGVVSLVFGDLAVGLGLYGPTAALAACAAVLATFKLVVGRKADEVEAPPAVPTEVA